MLSKEIGSEFWDIPTQDTNNLVFNEDIKWFISGRAALDYVIKDIKNKKNDVKKALLPSWCCDTMIKPFLENNIEVDFYSITFCNDKLTKNIERKADILLNLDYFGYEDNEELSFDGIIINDVTHSIFTNIKDNCDYYFGSLRKWAGFKTGGYACCKDGFEIKEPKNTDNQYVSLRINAMEQKQKYIDGELSSKEYLDIYLNAEEMLDVLYDCSGYEDDIEKAKKLDNKLIKEKRQENAKQLLTKIKEYAIFKDIKKNDCPLFVPIIVPNGKRNELREYLISKNIYCPIHWPISEYHRLNKDERYLFDNELSIVCDQRYSIEDMNYIIECIEDFNKC